MEQGYNLKRVHKVNLLAVYGIALIFILKTIAFWNNNMEDIYSSLAVMVLATIIFLIPIKDYAKGLLIALVPMLTGVALFILQGFDLGNHYLAFVSITMVALYFESSMLLIFGGVTAASYIGLFALMPEELLGDAYGINSFLTIMVMALGIIIFLYFLTKWGKELIQSAMEKEEQVNRAFSSLSQTMAEVEDGTQVLNSSTSVMTDNASETLTSTKQVAIAMQEIAIGVQEQAESVSDINMQVEAISNDVNEAHVISEKLTDSNAVMMSEVTSGEAEVQHMKNQMQIIDNAIEAAIVTVKDLEESMGDIQNFLGVITNISSQTNLLALNASIESARAGEAGKGFAVVADEIRKLAEQSAASVQDIISIVNSVNIKTEETVQTVSQGNEAVDEGTGIIDRITTQYSSIKHSFMENNQALGREIKMIEQINSAFGIVHDKISNIASISQEQSASSEEILATIENQEANIVNLTDSLRDIDSTSLSLYNLVEENNRSQK